MMPEKKLEVRDLRLSFRTNAGKVQAVRDISFDLYKGETLAIVGESGSGKSVTSRAIMGIMAGNGITEGGKILYGDKDLLKITEEEFHKIRGDKIAMVFQDPLSSLNPIMRVGAQLIEAMLLKNKASRKESKKRMNDMFAALQKNMEAAGIENAAADIASFKKFELRHTELQHDYTVAFESAEQAAAMAGHLRLIIENNGSKRTLQQDAADLRTACKRSENRFVVTDTGELLAAADAMLAAVKKGKRSDDYSAAAEPLRTIEKIASEATAKPVPDTFALGYYLTFVENEIPDLPTEELNKKAEAAAEGFLTPFLGKIAAASRYAAAATDENRRAAIALLQEKRPILAESEKREEAEAAAKQLKAAVSKCINPLEVVKDSLTHTFTSSIDYALELYYTGEKRNAAEEKRFRKDNAKYDKLTAKGKTPDWQVIPASFIDLDAARAELTETVDEMVAHFEEQLEQNKTADHAARAGQIVNYLKQNAQDSVYTLSKQTAREKAIKLMESVGIDEPRRRFRQYPFEFSGGMRQRVVIAIALTADPDVLICDEPTTALDVTIQAQILELINKLKKERDLSIIFITHDLGVVANMADRIAVMYAGKIVEYGTAEEVFYSPAHPYTWALLSSVPDLDTKEKLESIPGTPPNMIYPPKGDAFAERNKYALEIDFEEQPPMFPITETHYAATWLLHPAAPKLEPPAVVTERIKRMQERGGKTDV